MRIIDRDVIGRVGMDKIGYLRRRVRHHWSVNIETRIGKDLRVVRVDFRVHGLH